VRGADRQVKSLSIQRPRHPFSRNSRTHRSASGSSCASGHTEPANSVSAPRWKATPRKRNSCASAPMKSDRTNLSVARTAGAGWIDCTGKHACSHARGIRRRGRRDRPNSDSPIASSVHSTSKPIAEVAALSAGRSRDSRKKRRYRIELSESLTLGRRESGHAIRQICQLFRLANRDARRTTSWFCSATPACVPTSPAGEHGSGGPRNWPLFRPCSVTCASPQRHSNASLSGTRALTIPFLTSRKWQISADPWVTSFLRLIDEGQK
jgi:hypothetical protein